jgi:hypothetical protein
VGTLGERSVEEPGHSVAHVPISEGGLVRGRCEEEGICDRGGAPPRPAVRVKVVLIDAAAIPFSVSDVAWAKVIPLRPGRKL